MYFTLANRKKPLSLLLQAVSVLTRTTASILVVYTIFQKGRRTILLILHVPCFEDIMWSVLRLPSLRSGGDGPASEVKGSMKVCLKLRIDLSEGTHVVWFLVNQDLLKGNQTVVQMPIQ